MAVQYGLPTESTPATELVSLTTLVNLMKEKNADPFLILEIRRGGIGEDLVKEASEQG
jgi:hypothetical protein